MYIHVYTTRLANHFAKFSNHLADLRLFILLAYVYMQEYLANCFMTIYLEETDLSPTHIYL